MSNEDEDASLEVEEVEAVEAVDTTAPDVLEMSDEDFNSMSFDDVSADTAEESDDESTDIDAASSDTTDDNVEQSADAIDTPTEDVVDLSSNDKEDNSTLDSYEEDSSTNSDDEAKNSTKSTVDYKAEYEKILSPFRANNKEMQVENVEDALTLMKMGANYNKKMQALKPNLKIVKMLENNGLLDEARISNLIDLDKKNPEAIKKLIKDSGMDPLDIDVQEESEYTPSTYTVDDGEMELDNVLSEIKDSTGFKDTIDIISNKWDESSKKVLVGNPGVIRVINEHVERGIYAKISTVVERERMLGRLTGLNDIEAYKQVGDLINAQGGFAADPNINKDATNTETAGKKLDTKVDPKLKTRKRAASHTQSTKVGKEPEFNPLSMSDEDFEKETLGKYM